MTLTWAAYADNGFDMFQRSKKKGRQNKTFARRPKHNVNTLKINFKNKIICSA